MLAKEQIDEIRMMYREAKNKQKQVGILAEMHLCSAEDIRKVLGLDTPGKKPEKARQNDGKTEAKTEKVPKSVPKVPKISKMRLKVPKLLRQGASREKRLIYGKNPRKEFYRMHWMLC